MNLETLELLKGKLHDMLQGLEDEVSTTLDGMRREGSAFPDPTDRATMESDRNLTS